MHSLLTQPGHSNLTPNDVQSRISDTVCVIQMIIGYTLFHVFHVVLLSIFYIHSVLTQAGHHNLTPNDVQLHISDIFCVLPIIIAIHYSIYVFHVVLLSIFYIPSILTQPEHHNLTPSNVQLYIYEIVYIFQMIIAIQYYYKLSCPLLQSSISWCPLSYSMKHERRCPVTVETCGCILVNKIQCVVTVKAQTYNTNLATS
jgi:hypothetical protein